LLHFSAPDTTTIDPPTATIDFAAPTFEGIFPNPTTGNAVASFILTEKTAAKLTVSDALGRIIFSKNETFPAGNSSFLLDFEQKGVFFYKIEMAGTVFSGRILRI
jgi:hypothetical protein